MKKITFSILLLASVIFVSAQNQFKPFKFDLSTGYAIPSGKGAKGGILFVGEPKYAVIPNLSVGLRFEIAVMARGMSDASGNVAQVDVKAAGSYLATGDYYFTQNVVRPFSGVGLGIYSLASASASNSTAAAGAGSKFGEMVRAGVEISHFRLGFEYNIVPTTNIQAVDAQSGETYTITSKNSYIGIKIGATIGGGRIKK
jgi:outer membrane protein X